VTAARKLQNLSEETLLPVLDYLYRVAEKIYAGKAGYDRVRSNVDELKQKMEEGTFSRTQRTWNTVIRFFKWSSGKKLLLRYQRPCFNPGEKTCCCHRSFEES